MSTSPATERAPARTLTEELRGRSDEDLVALVRDRPDLRTPIPADIAALAARATSRPSTQRALDHLDLLTLQVLDVLIALPDGSSRDDVRRLLGGIAPDGPLSRLRGLALVYGRDDDLTVTRSVREIVPEPAGLGPPAEQALRGYGPARLARLLTDLGGAPSGDPVTDARAVAAIVGDPQRVTQALGEADAAVQRLLATLTWGPPTGRVDRADREVSRAGAATPVEWLLARGLLLALDPSTVALPREVALVLRGGRVHREVQAAAPEPSTRPVDPDRTDHTAAGAAATAVRLVDDLLELWALDPPKALRAGGIGVRDRARSAAALEVSDADLALLVETAHAAGLLGPGGDVDEVWLPTPAYDDWRARDVAARWAVLAGAWLTTVRVAALAGERDDRDRVLAPLGPDLARSVAPQVRAEVLAELAALPREAATTPAALADRLRWRAPRLAGRLRQDLVGWTMREADALGLGAGGALGEHGRRLVAGDLAAAERMLHALLPEPLDHVLLQADLTAVAPGPLTSDLAHRLGVLADIESRGGATVYRFTDASVRRALDAGWTAAEVLALLGTHSRTPVPQPLTYLVEDVARRHGRIRVGVASAYLRCDDEGTLTELLADRRVAALRLRRLAPTVVAAQAPVDAVLARLREMGLAPAAEGPDGDLVVRRPDARRAPAARRPAPLPEPSGPPAAVLSAAVRAIRAGDRARLAVTRTPGGGARLGPPASPTVDVLALLQEAVGSGATLWIGYVDAHGQASQRLIEPAVVQGGFVEAFDHLRQEVRTFAVHRITGAAIVDEPAG